MRDHTVAVVALLGDVALRLILRSRRRATVVVDTHNLYRVAARAESMAAQQDGERLSEVSIEGIDDRVERRVGPTEPDKDIEGGGTDAQDVRALVGVTERNHAVQDEEGQPTAHENAHDDREGLENFGFTFEGHLEGTFGLHTGIVTHATVAVLGAFGSSFECRDPAYLLMGNAVDACVSDQHNGHRYVKTDQGGGDGICPIKAGVAVVWRKLAICAVQLRVTGRLGFVPVQLHGDEGDKDGQRPRHTYHDERHLGRHLALVAERARNGPVAVHADDAQIQDGGGGTHDVKGHPDIAEGAEWPKPYNLSGRFPWHHQNGHQQVRNSQRYNKEVGDF